jgi:flagellar biosynthesis/type III secretory pathway protein FliH
VTLSTTETIAQRATDALHQAIQIAYERGYSEASNEILTEVIGAIESRIKGLHAEYQAESYAGLEVALAIVKGLKA